MAQKVITYFAGYNYYRVFNRYTVLSQKLFTFKTVRGTTFIVQTFIVCVTKWQKTISMDNRPKKNKCECIFVVKCKYIWFINCG